MIPTKASRVSPLAASAVLLLALALSLGYARCYYVGQLNDDAYYVLGARTLLQGHYADLADPFRRAMPFFSPGFPLFLAPFVLLLAPHWDALRFAILCVTGASALALARLFAPWLSPAGCLILLALYAGNAVVARSASSVMTDPFFTLLALCAFLILRRVLRRDSAAAALLLGLVLGWELVVRPTGVVLAASVGAGLFLARRWRAASLASAPALGIWALDAWRSLAGHRSGIGYWPRWQESVGFLSDLRALADQSQRVINLFFVAVPFGIQLPYSAAGFAANAALVSACVLLAARGARSVAARGPAEKALAAAMLLYGLGLLSAQASWAAISARYALPFLPLLLGLLLAGALPAGAPVRRVWSLAALAALVLVWSNVAAYRRACDAAGRPAGRFPARTLEWLREHTPADAVLLSPRPAMMFLYSRRQALSEPREPAVDREEFYHALLEDGISYFVASPMEFLYRPGRPVQPADLWRQSSAWAASWPQAFRSVFSDPVEATTVYRVAAGPEFLKAYGLYQAARRQLASGQTAQGLKTLDSALAIRPDFVKALNAYGAACLLSGSRLDAGENRLKRALAVDQHSFWARLNLARLYRRTGRLAAARQALEQAALELPRSPDRAGPAAALAGELSELRARQR